MDFLSYHKNLSFWKNKTGAIDDHERMQANQNVKFLNQQINPLYGKVELESDLLSSIIEKYNKGKFIITFYQAYRKVKMSEPKNPTKPIFNKKGN